VKCIIIKVYTFIDSGLIKVYTYIQAKGVLNMNKKSTLSEESYNLYRNLIKACEQTMQGTDCYERLNRIRGAAQKRWERRHEQALYSGKEVITNKVNKVGRPKKENKKVQINIKLPPELIEWMDRQPEKRPFLIETALKNYYQIPEY
jgi:hypothetical protein